MLTDVARLETGHTPSRKHSEYWGGEVPWIGIRDATENHGRIIFDTYQHTNGLGIANSSARILPANTVCLSRTASVGYVVVMGKPMATSQDFVNWVCSEAIDYRFLKYVLLVEHYAFVRFASGTTHQTIYFPEVKAFHVCLPPIGEQHAIVSLLGALDDKIDLNRRMNETLEAMARAIFKDWFVDFGPTRTKVEGRQPYLAPDLWYLFPDIIDDNGMPHEWSMRRMEEIAEYIAMGPFGSNIKVSTFVPEGIPIISGQHLNNTMLEDSEFNFITRDHADRLRNSNVYKGDIVFTHAGNIGQVSYIPESAKFNRYILSQRQFYMRCDREKISPIFMIYFFKLPEGQHKLLANTSSTGVPSISRPVTNLKSIEFCLPSKPVIDAFEKIVQPFHLAIGKNIEQSNTLGQLRDLLLPKLMSGDIRLKEAEKLVEKSL